MKNSCIIILFALVIMFSSCDYVKNPTDVAPTIANNSNTIVRKILIEDYTGHYCGQCPPAAEELHKIDSLYKGRIIGLAVHAGFFANTRNLYPTDFRNATGDAYDNQFGNSAAGNPNGLINRVGYPSTTHIKSWSSWNGIVSQQLNTLPKFQLNIKNNFNSTSNMLNTDITIKSLTNTSGNYKLVVLLSEDSLVAEQKDDRVTPNLISNYIFKHVLRDAINSTWGESVFLSGAAINDSIIKSYTNYNLNPTYLPKHCHVVAFIYDADPSSQTYYEVLQVEEEKVK